MGDGQRAGLQKPSDLARMRMEAEKKKAKERAKAEAIQELVRGQGAVLRDKSGKVISKEEYDKLHRKKKKMSEYERYVFQFLCIVRSFGRTLLGVSRCPPCSTYSIQFHDANYERESVKHRCGHQLLYGLRAHGPVLAQLV